MFLAAQMYVVAIVIIKASIAVSILRIITSKLQRRVIHVTLISTLLASALLSLTMVLQCRPVSKNWYPLEPGWCTRTATSVQSALYITSIIYVLGDIALGAVPAMVIKNLKVNRRSKVVLAIIIGLSQMFV